MRRLLLVLLISTPATVWSAQSEVLVIGDSQSYGSFGSRLLGQLRNDNKVSTSYYSRPGSGAKWWLDGDKAPEDWGSWNAPQDESEVRVPQALATPKIEDLIAKHQPELVVVQLGGNMVNLSNSMIRAEVKQLVAKIRTKGSNCLWVGPPPGDARPEPRYSEFYNVLKESVEKGGCRFVDSRPLIVPVPHGGDGRHLDTMEGGLQASEKWTQQISETVLKSLRRSAATGSPDSKAAPSKTHHSAPPSK
jgi:hypothetical protein